MTARFGPFAFMIATVSIAVFCSSYASAGPKKAKRKKGREETFEVLNKAEYELKLRKVARSEIASAPRDVDPSSARLVHQKPFFFREFTVYPDGPDAYELVLHERESRSAPYWADIKVHRERYRTKNHRKKQDARSDTNFRRDIGTQRITYELRNGKWARRGSLYTAGRMEERIAGEWVALGSKEKVLAPFADAVPEEKKGVFGRMWNGIRFWR